MNQGSKRAAGASYMPDMQEWWGEMESGQVPSRQQRPRHRAQSAPVRPEARTEARPEARPRAARRRQVALSRGLMYITVAVLLAGLFVQINRYAQMASQTKYISTLVNEVKGLESDRDNLRLRLSAREGQMDRLREEAEYKLGMQYAKEGQVRVIHVAGLSSGEQGQTAAIPAD